MPDQPRLPAANPARSRRRAGQPPRLVPGCRDGSKRRWWIAPALGRRRSTGPLIVQEYDATCLVPPRRAGGARCVRQYRYRRCVSRPLLNPRSCSIPAPAQAMPAHPRGDQPRIKQTALGSTPRPGNPTLETSCAPCCSIPTCSFTRSCRSRSPAISCWRGSAGCRRRCGWSRRPLSSTAGGIRPMSRCWCSPSVATICCRC